MKTLTWQKPGQQNVAQELIKIIINYVAELRIEKEQGVRITRQLTSNRALQKALENPEVKNAIMDVIESSIEEILANQKKVEL